MSVGAPPDIVTTSGQNWGFEPLAPEALQRSAYEYLRAYLSHHMSAAGMLRIDHAMGLHRLYWIPQGAGAREGVYVHYAADELYAVHCLESHRNQSAIAGENLGIVPVRVNDGLAEHGIAKMYVMSIELRDDEWQPFRQIPKGVVASFGTHDLPPFAAFWQESDIEERVRLGVLTQERSKVERRNRTAQKAALVAYLQRRGALKDGATSRAPQPPASSERGSETERETEKNEPAIDEIFRGVLDVLASSRAERVIVNLEDLWLAPQPQNVPGTLDDQHPNWRRRAKYGLDELDGVPAVRAALDAVRRLRPNLSASVLLSASREGKGQSSSHGTSTRRPHG
jgi:4-alpha-glucanotransferase